MRGKSCRVNSSITSREKPAAKERKREEKISNDQQGINSSTSLYVDNNGDGG